MPSEFFYEGWARGDGTTLEQVKRAADAAYAAADAADAAYAAYAAADAAALQQCADLVRARFPHPPEVTR